MFSLYVTLSGSTHYFTDLTERNRQTYKICGAVDKTVLLCFLFLSSTPTSSGNLELEEDN